MPIRTQSAVIRRIPKARAPGLKFDSAGSVKALSLLKAMKKDTDLNATVTGTLKRDVITVETLDIQ